MQSWQPLFLLSAGSIGARLAVLDPATGDARNGRIDALDERDYHPRLPTSRLIAEVRRLLATERWAERLVCRYLADLADRVQARQDAELGAYTDEYQAARYFFGLGAREMRERVRVGRALRRLPRIERAFAEGQLCYSRVREATRVATADTELDWLELARRLDMRSLERCVAGEREPSGARSEGRAERRTTEAAHTEWTSAGTVRVTFELSSEGFTLLKRAMREARRAGGAGLSEGEALEAVARAALSLQTERVGTCDAGRGVVGSAGSNSGNREPDAGATDMAEPRPAAPVVSGSGAATRGTTAHGLRTPATHLGSMVAFGTEATQPGLAAAFETRVTHLGSMAAVGTEATQPGLAAAFETQATHLGSMVAFGTEATRLGSPAALRRPETPGAMGLESEPDRTRREPDRTRVEPDRTRGGPSSAPTDQWIDHERVGIVSGEQALPSEPAQRLFQVMGHRSGWTLDALAEASGLSVHEVSVALTLLELAGCVRRRAFAFDPV
jgi:hypothetical protein